MCILFPSFYLNLFGEVGLRGRQMAAGTTDLFKLVGEFLWVHLHRREHVLALSQVKHLDCIREHGAHLLILICAILTRLHIDTKRQKEKR